MTKKSDKKKPIKTKAKPKKSATVPTSYYFGELKKEKIKDAPVYGWPGP